MRVKQSWFGLLFLACLSLLLSACASNGGGTAVTKQTNPNVRVVPPYNPSTYASRLPSEVNTGGVKEVLVSPREHAWGAYGADGKQIKGGMATAGADYCPDLGRACHTHSGTFHVLSLGSSDCKSHIFPIPRGGAPMPYCMYFNHGQALHGSPEGEVVDGNISHGCVRLHVQDAEWLRFNFVNPGTKVVIESY